MRVLCLIPPMIPSYFNAGHHLPVFMVASFLRRALPAGTRVDAIDACALNHTWRDVIDLLMEQYDIVALMNDYDGIDTFRRFMAYARELSPRTKIVTFGRLSKQIPRFFQQYGCDGILVSGDYEAGLAGFVEHLSGGALPPGVMVRRGDGSYTEPAPGIYLEPEQWVLPDIEDIPYAAYDRMYGNDLNKFCGIPERRELVVPVARGCPVGCSFCDVPGMQGLKERRLDVERTLDYIESCFRQAPFEYVSFYAPTFTLRKRWVEELCAGMQARGMRAPWKCVTTLAHLNEPLLETMARAGCVRVSIGLETLDPGASKSLPMAKQGSDHAFETIASRCRALGIELNCFVICGLPGDSIEGVQATVDAVLRHDARVRPTVYTPYHQMHDDMGEAEAFLFNRQLLLPTLRGPAERGRYYELLYRNQQDRATRVMDKIPERAAEAREHGPAPEQEHGRAHEQGGNGARHANGRFALAAHMRGSLAQVPAKEKRDYRRTINLSSNELAHRLVSTLVSTWSAELTGELVSQYPYHPRMRTRVAEFLRLRREQVVLGPGSDTTIQVLMQQVAAATGRLVLHWPNYEAYERFAHSSDVSVLRVPFGYEPPIAQLEAMERAVKSSPPATVVLTNPNGFTGEAWPLELVFRLAATCAQHGHLLIVDEAYADFAGLAHHDLLAAHDNVVALRSFSKGFGMAGLRVCSVAASEELAAYLLRAATVHAVSSLSLSFLEHCLDNIDTVRQMQAEVQATRERVRQRLETCPGLTLPRSSANFVHVDAGDARVRDAMVQRLLAEDIVVRNLAGVAGFDTALRMTVAEWPVMQRVLDIIEGVLERSGTGTTEAIAC